MMNRIVLLACATIGLGTTGCSNTVRYMTATHWTSTPGGVAASGVAASGVAAPAEAAPEAKESAPATPAAAPTGSRTFYLSYWEGSCSSGALGFGKGCSKGDSRVKRCNVRPDNSLVCVDEKEIDKALSTSN